MKDETINRYSIIEHESIVHHCNELIKLLNHCEKDTLIKFKSEIIKPIHQRHQLIVRSFEVENFTSLNISKKEIGVFLKAASTLLINRFFKEKINRIGEEFEDDELEDYFDWIDRCEAIRDKIKEVLVSDGFNDLLKKYTIVSRNTSWQRKQNLIEIETRKILHTEIINRFYKNHKQLINKLNKL